MICNIDGVHKKRNLNMNRSKLSECFLNFSASFLHNNTTSSPGEHQA